MPTHEDSIDSRESIRHSPPTKSLVNRLSVRRRGTLWMECPGVQGWTHFLRTGIGSIRSWKARQLLRRTRRAAHER